MRIFKIHILIVIVFLSIVVAGFVNSNNGMTTVQNTIKKPTDIIFRGNPTTGYHTHGGDDPAWLSISTFEVINNSDKKLEITLERASFVYGIIDKTGAIELIKESNLGAPIISSDIMTKTDIFVMPNSSLYLNLNYNSLSSFALNNSNEYEAVRLWIKVGDEIVMADSKVLIYRREPWSNE